MGGATCPPGSTSDTHHLSKRSAVRFACSSAAHDERGNMRNLVKQPTARWHDGQITSDFQKSCPALEANIFRFRSTQITGITPPVSRQWGALANVTNARRDAMDATAATRRVRLERTAKSCGSGAAVLAPSPGGAILVGDGGKRAVLRGEHEVSRKAIAQGRPECSSCPVCSCATFVMRKSHARPRVQQAPGLPCAL